MHVMGYGSVLVRSMSTAAVMPVAIIIGKDRGSSIVLPTKLLWRQQQKPLEGQSVLASVSRSSNTVVRHSQLVLSARLPVRTPMRAGFSKGHAVRGMIGSKCGFAHVAGLRNDT